MGFLNAIIRQSPAEWLLFPLNLFLDLGLNIGSRFYLKINEKDPHCIWRNFEEKRDEVIYVNEIIKEYVSLKIS